MAPRPRALLTAGRVFDIKAPCWLIQPLPSEEPEQWLGAGGRGGGTARHAGHGAPCAQDSDPAAHEGLGSSGPPAVNFPVPLQDFSSYLSDGLHLSPKGNEFLFSHLWPLIEKRVCSLPLLLPYWRDIAEAQPERSLLGDGDH